MGILETMYTIVSTICCTFKKDKNEDIKIKIVETYINKTEDTDFNHPELSNTNDVKNSIEPEIKNIIIHQPCNHMFAEQCKQRHQNSSVMKDKSQMTIVTNKHCCCYLSDLNESINKYNISLLYPSLCVSNSTKNSKSNCSIDNTSISTSYKSYRNNEENTRCNICNIQDVTYKNKPCPLTSTNVNSHKRSLRKFTAKIFHPFLQKIV